MNDEFDDDDEEYEVQQEFTVSREDLFAIKVILANAATAGGNHPGIKTYQAETVHSWFKKVNKECAEGLDIVQAILEGRRKS